MERTTADVNKEVLMMRIREEQERFENKLDAVAEYIGGEDCWCSTDGRCMPCRIMVAFKRLRAERDRYAAFTITEFIEAGWTVVDATIRDVTDSRESDS